MGSAGCIAARANVVPKTVAKLCNLWAAGRAEEALLVPHALALADFATKAGITSTSILLRLSQPHVPVSVMM